MIQNLRMFALPAPYHRGEKLNLRLLRQSHNVVHHLVHRLLLNLPSALRAMGNTDSRIEKSHVIINLCHRSHRRTRVTVRGLLIDGNGGGQPLDTLHIRLLHLTQELAGIGRQRLHITPLPFRVNRVKRQGRFAGTTETR